MKNENSFVESQFIKACRELRSYRRLGLLDDNIWCDVAERYGFDEETIKDLRCADRIR